MYSEPSNITNDQGDAFQFIANTIRSNFPGSIVAPLLCVGATDARKFEAISHDVLRFSPATDLVGLHGVNERVTLTDFQNGVNFYYHVLHD